MYVRKIIQLGRSLGVTIPKEYLEFMGVRKGELVIVRMAAKTTVVIQKQKVEPLSEIR